VGASALLGLYLDPCRCLGGIVAARALYSICGLLGALSYRALYSIGRSLFIWRQSASGALRSLGARSIGRSPFIGRSILSALCCAPHLSIRLSAFYRRLCVLLGNIPLGAFCSLAVL